jgi:hypothetical protein
MRVRAAFRRGEESWQRCKPDEDSASWSLPVLFVHLDTFSAGEIMQD